MNGTVKNKDLVLRRLTFSDKIQLAELANNKKIWNNIRDYFPHPYTLGDAEQFIKLTQGENPQTTFAISFGEEFVGVVGLVLRTDVYRKSAEIGYWVGEPYWNKGIAERAVNLIVEYGFTTLQLERIDTGIFAFNKASARVLEKCGFEFEGIFKNSIFKNNRISDELRYGIIKQKVSPHET